MTDGTCRICGKTIKNNAKGANKAHAATHSREFEERTGLSKHTEYDIVVAYFSPEDAPKWARELVDRMREHGALNVERGIEEFIEDSGMADAIQCSACDAIWIDDSDGVGRRCATRHIKKERKAEKEMKSKSGVSYGRTSHKGAKIVELEEVDE